MLLFLFAIYFSGVSAHFVHGLGHQVFVYIHCDETFPPKTIIYDFGCSNKSSSISMKNSQIDNCVTKLTVIKVMQFIVQVIYNKERNRFDLTLLKQNMVGFLNFCRWDQRIPLMFNGSIKLMVA